MSYLNRAAPAPKRKDIEPEPREYIVVSDRCVWGKPGEVITLTITDNQELSLLEAGTVKVAPAASAKAVEAKPADASAKADEKPPTSKRK